MRQTFFINNFKPPYIFLLFCFLLVLSNENLAQQHDQLNLFFENKKQNDQQTNSKINVSITHINLDIEPVFEKEILYGKARLTITPYYFNNMETIILNAKMMDINSVKLQTSDTAKPIKLNYKYDSALLTIALNKKYKMGDTLHLIIDYVAHPKRIKSVESKAITDSKGLYFINADEKKNDLPVQIWTQGEPENSSVWFPIIEQQQQKFTQEINITVPKKFQTISNGLMVSSIQKEQGKRTDSWKLSLPNSPYLVFFAVGQWSVYNDSFKKIAVNYYVNKEFANVAKKIFGKTPKMISAFENIFQVPFVWPKYDQVVVNNFVSGAMENTSVVVHDENALQDEKDLEDENAWENVISHELAHHWFGDLVTCKNWSNLTLNESFANYSEYLWFEYEYGKFFADYYRHKEIQAYFSPSAMEKTLVRTDYQKPEDVFDEVTYNKGGAILHMLRSYLGDSVFFKSLQTYLLENKFNTAEVATLRMAFEKISGENLNWFFNQWYFNSGNPFIAVQKSIDPINKQIIIIIKQNVQVGDNVFKIPIQIAKYENGNKSIHSFWIGSNGSNTDTLFIPYKTLPDLISTDPEGNILMVKQEMKSTKEYIYQLKTATNYYEKNEALYHLAREQHESTEALNAMLEASYDSSFLIRLQVLEKLDIVDEKIKLRARPYCIQNFKTETNNLVIAKLIDMLSVYKLPDFYENNKHLLKSKSAKIVSATLQLLFSTDSIKHFNTIAKVLEDVKSKTIHRKAFRLFLAYKKTKKNINVTQQFKKLSFSNKLDLIKNYLEYMVETEDPELIQEAINYIKEMKTQLPENYKYVSTFIDREVDEVLGQLKRKNKKIHALIIL